jgi:hypothetical protein
MGNEHMQKKILVKFIKRKKITLVMEFNQGFDDKQCITQAAEFITGQKLLYYNDTAYNVNQIVSIGLKKPNAIKQFILKFLEG